MAVVSLILLDAAVFAEEIGVPANIDNNVLIIVLDDLGIDVMRVYDRDASLYGIDDIPDLPNISALADEGILFRNAWVHPVCSPTRSSILTGRYPFRTGVGHALAPPPIAECVYDLQEGECTLPEVFKALYRPGASPVKFAAIGKWHLTCGMSWDDPRLLRGPVDSGFDFYAGTLFNLGPAYPPGSCTGWWKVVNGAAMPEPTLFYATSDNVDDAHTWITEREREGAPWFLYLAFNAPHAPYHHPPDGLYSGPLPVSCSETKATRRACYLAMVEAVDYELGRLFTRLARHPAGILDRTTICFLGDNGTPGGPGDGDVTVPPFDPFHAKGSVYEGGVNVPLLIRSPVTPSDYRGCESDALVNGVDLFATSLEIFLGPHYEDLMNQVMPPGGAIDSRSIVPILRDPSSAGSDVRQYSYTEIFMDPQNPKRAIRNIVRRTAARGRSPCLPIAPVTASYKLIIRSSEEPGQYRREFYEVVSDPFEANDYFDELNPYHPDWGMYVDLCRTFNDLVDLDIECPEAPVAQALAGKSPPGISISRGDWPQPGHPFFVRTSLPVDRSVEFSQDASVEVYHPNGSRVRVLWSGELKSLPTTIGWDGRNDEGRRVASGRYFLRLREGSRTLHSQGVTVLR
jgi:arylsulfatase A-like enzyme